MKVEDKATVESPCVQVCVLNEQDICIGCGRSLNEIGQWLDATTQEKTNILAAANQRLANSKQQGQA